MPTRRESRGMGFLSSCIPCCIRFFAAMKRFVLWRRLERGSWCGGGARKSRWNRSKEHCFSLHGRRCQGSCSVCLAARSSRSRSFSGFCFHSARFWPGRCRMLSTCGKTCERGSIKSKRTYSFFQRKRTSKKPSGFICHPRHKRFYMSGTACFGRSGPARLAGAGRCGRP